MAKDKYINEDGLIKLNQELNKKFANLEKNDISSFNTSKPSSDNTISINAITKNNQSIQAFTIYNGLDAKYPYASAGTQAVKDLNEKIDNIQLTPGPQGPKGDTGAAAGFGTPTASVDSTTGTPKVTVTASGSNTAKVFNFKFTGLKGEKGDTGTPGTNGTNGTNGKDGTAATITVGSVTTLAAGANATVKNSGTTTAAKFDFGIPQGAKGDKGDTGPSGTLTTTSTNALSTATNESLAGNINLHKVSKTGSYNDLLNKPTIPSDISNFGYSDSGYYTDITANKKDGTNLTVLRLYNNTNSTSIGMALDSRVGKLLNDKIDNINTYSTNEQIIGKWINGKTLYRKTITFSKSASSTGLNISSSFSIDNVDNIWLDESNSFILNKNNNLSIQTGYYASANDWARTYIDGPNKIARVYLGSVYANIGLDIVITLKYTKVND